MAAVRDSWNTIQELKPESKFQRWLSKRATGSNIPELKEHILQGTITGFEDTLDHKLATVDYGLGELGLKNFNVPSANAHITFSEPANIVFVWTGVSATSKQFKW